MLARRSPPPVRYTTDHHHHHHPSPIASTPSYTLSYANKFKNNNSYQKSTVESSFTKAVYFVAFLSWLAALALSSSTQASIQQMEQRTATFHAQNHEKELALETIRERIVTERNHLTMLQETKQALEHKVRLSQEDMPELPLQLSYAASTVEPDEYDATILDWLDHRKEGLAHQIRQLQHYMQAFSRRKVKEE